MSTKPTDKLKAVFDGAPELDKEICTELVSLYDRKLWHELTLKLRTVFDSEDFVPYLHDIFIGFVSEFGHKLNLLSFAKFAHSVAKDMDQDSAVMLLKKQVDDLKELKGHPIAEPILLLEMSIAEQYIDITHMDDCKELLDSGLKKLDEMSEVCLSIDHRCCDLHVRDRCASISPHSCRSCSPDKRRRNSLAGRSIRISSSTQRFSALCEGPARLFGVLQGSPAVLVLRVP
jgi:hypothetical protein